MPEALVCGGVVVLRWGPSPHLLGAIRKLRARLRRDPARMQEGRQQGQGATPVPGRCGSSAARLSPTHRRLASWARGVRPARPRCSHTGSDVEVNIVRTSSIVARLQYRTHNPVSKDSCRRGAQIVDVDHCPARPRRGARGDPSSLYFKHQIVDDPDEVDTIFASLQLPLPSPSIQHEWQLSSQMLQPAQRMSALIASS